MPCHLLELCRQFHTAYFLEQSPCHILEEVDHVFLVNEAHLAVDLCEFRLAVGSKVFVPEAFCNLEIAVKSADHKQLLECLWALWQGVELSWIHT